MDTAARRSARRSLLSGLLAAPVGFVLSAFVLIPLWWIFAFSMTGSSALMPALVSFGIGIGYAIVMAMVTAAGIPRRWWTALCLLLLGAIAGVELGSYMREAILDGCLRGTGPQPAYCDQQDPEVLRPVIPAYVAACAFLGLALWLPGALNLGRAPDVSKATEQGSC